MIRRISHISLAERLHMRFSLAAYLAGKYCSADCHLVACACFTAAHLHYASDASLTEY